MNHPYRAKSPNLPMHLYFTDRDVAHGFAQAQSASLPGRHTVEWQAPHDPDRWALIGWYENGLWTGAHSHFVVNGEIL